MTQTFAKGQFQSYRALTKIHFGSVPLDVQKDDIVEFDGTTVRIAGSDHVIPAMKGAIKTGWFVPEADNISQYIAKRADIKLRPALQAGEKPLQDSVVTEMTDEEREVGSLESTKAKRMAAADPTQRHTPVASGDDPASQIAALLAQVQALQAQLATKVATPAPVVVSKVESDLSDSDLNYSDTSGQGAVPVSRIKSSAVQTFKADDQSIRQVEQALQVDGKPLNVERLAVNPVRVAKSVRLSPDSATGDVLESREGYELEDVLPGAIKGKPKGKPGVVNTEGTDNSPQVVVFVNAPDGSKHPWDKSQHWRVRVKTLLDKYTDEDLIKAILAVEDAGVVREYERMSAKAKKA